MPQNPTPVVVGKTPAGGLVPLNTDASGNLATAQSAAAAPTQPNLDAQGSLRASTIAGNSALGIAANAVIKAGPGKVTNAHVIVGGSTDGAVHDCLTTAAASATNQICTIPALTTGQISDLQIQMIAKTGIVAIPGTGQTFTLGYE